MIELELIEKTYRRIKKSYKHAGMKMKSKDTGILKKTGYAAAGIIGAPVSVAVLCTVVVVEAYVDVFIIMPIECCCCSCICAKDCRDSKRLRKQLK